ncbi:hypothetical protein GCM10008012_13710 [Rhizobium anhuiense]|nr:hypothetical protein GCM10008012_13710 [Rhizobium anhuiense]
MASGFGDGSIRQWRAAVVRDASGNFLADGDSVTVIKDLKVKGAGLTLKQGTVIRSIRLTIVLRRSIAAMMESRASFYAPSSCANANSSSQGLLSGIG